jgi:hypothetical protein
MAYLLGQAADGEPDALAADVLEIGSMLESLIGAAVKGLFAKSK